MPLEAGDLVVTETPREGWTVASEGGLTVALDLTVTPELERAGLAREAVRLVQEARKNSGLAVSDRIELWWTAGDSSADPMAQAVAAADPAALVAAYRAGTATVDVDGQAVPLEDGDLVVTETPQEGWTVASAGGLTVALDLTLTPELERAGLVREAVRLVQEARKSSGLAVSDRIELWWTAEGPMAEALTEHGEQVGGEVLAATVHAGVPGDGAGVEGPSGSRFWLARA